MSIYKRLLSYSVTYWFAYLIGILGFGVYALTQWAWAHIMQTLIEVLEAKAFEQTLWLAVFVLVVFFVRGIGSFLGMYGIAYVSRMVIRDLRNLLFEHFMNLPLSYYLRTSSGKLTAKITYDLEQVSGACSTAFKILIQEGLTVVVLLIYLFYSNWRLSLLFLLAAPLIAIIVQVASKRLRRLSENIQSSMGDVNQIASETIKGFHTVKSFVAEAQRLVQFSKASEDNCRQGLKLETTNALSIPLVQFLVGTQLAMLMAIAYVLGAYQASTTAEFMAYLTASALLTKPLRQLTQVNTVLQRGIAAAKSVFSVLDQPKESNPGKETPEIHGRIEFSRVGFRYPEATKDALTDINLCVERGQTVAFVGRTGGGKSTLVNLLLGYYPVVTGEILLDGVPIETIERKHLRKHIGLVSQDLVFFEGSVEENLRLGQLSEKDRSQLEKAASTAHALEFIQHLEDSWRFNLKENAFQLSGGQRQRLAIARALLKDSPVLILDEATSALDNESERWVKTALDERLGDCTTLVVAHRLSTVENADCIYVLDEGRIVEQGTHSQLLSLKGYYARLYESQAQAEA